MKNIVEVLVAFVIAAAAVGMFITTCSVSRQSDPVTVIVSDTVWETKIVYRQRPPIAFTARAARVECSDSVISDTTRTDSAGRSERVVIMAQTQIASIDTTIFGVRIRDTYNSARREFSPSLEFPVDSFAVASAQITKTIEKMMPRPWWEPPAYVAGGTVIGAGLVLILRGLK